jgi:hypothetical protein
MTKTLTIVLFLVSLLASVASGATLTLGNGTSGGVQYGHYVGTINSTINDQPIKVICDDYFDTATFGATYIVNVSTIPSLTYAEFKTTPGVGVDGYQDAAIILAMLNGDIPNTNSYSIATLQYALWNRFASGTPDHPSGTAINAVFSTVNNFQAHNSIDYSNFRVFTHATKSESIQEFVGGSISYTPTPEPATFALSLLGGLLVGIGRYRSRQKS